MRLKLDKLTVLGALACATIGAQASWYWPFDFTSSPDRPRMSALMEPATTNIDAAADFAAEGKYKEAQECYRAAIAALNRIEQENPERASTPEFATVRNKRAYINAALDSMLLAEARENAKAVSVTDTTELEVRMVMKPWQEFQPTYVALTNADRLVTKRTAVVEMPWARAMLDSAAKAWMKHACASNRLELTRNRAELTTSRKALQAAYRAAALAVGRMKKLSGSATTPDGVRVFDVCKRDARKDIAACQDAWPKFGEALERAERALGGLHDVLFEICAESDFPEIVALYIERVKGVEVEDMRVLAQEQGYVRACRTMLEAMDAGKSGIIHKGFLYKAYAAWGGDEAEVPQKEDDRGLVKDGGDSRPEVESRIDKYMDQERKSLSKTKISAERIKARKDVEREVQRLLKEDPKSRKARMLMAGECLRDGDSAGAKAKIDELLAEKPNDGAALNMRAAIEAAEGDLKAAEKTLDQAIRSDPRDYHAYYNMANVFIQKGNVDGARRYYETGRSFAGPKDPELEKAVRRR